MPDQPLGKWKGYNLSGNSAAGIQFKKHTSCSLLQCDTKQHTPKTWKGLRVTWRIMSDEVALSFCMNTGSILTYLADISHYLERIPWRIISLSHNRSVCLSPQRAWPLYVSAEIPNVVMWRRWQCFESPTQSIGVPAIFLWNCLPHPPRACFEKHPPTKPALFVFNER